MSLPNRGPEEIVLILAPRGRDGALARDLLEAEGISARLCPDLVDFCAKLPESGAGLVTEEALSPHFDCLARALRDQPAWSDFPIVVFRSTEPDTAGHLLEMLEYLGNVTLLDRPVRKLNLATAVLAALRARRRQYELRDRLADLEENVRQRDRFLAILGHELRNPLAAITAAVELSRRRGKAVLSEEIGVVHRQSRHLARLVDDLLDVSRVTSGKIVLECAIVELAELAERCAESLAPSAAAREIDVSVIADRDVRVEGDPVRLEQSVTNVLNNAIKYTPRRGHIVVEVRREEGRALVAIRDTGAGISPEMLPHIFNLFTQAQDTLDRAQGGMGIGLTLVKSLVSLHGGRVEARSEGLGRGSEFRIWLPLAAAAPAGPGTPRDEPVPDSATRRIVLIEDNGDLRESIRQLLELDGHSVATAGDGAEGLELIRSLRPDVALIDIGLPRLDGYGVARTVRSELGRDARLIALTGYGQAEDREKAARAGFDGHLTKPITGRALRRVLSDASLPR
ncbi:MAG TPA: ATP-binding protein [Thermoanaerobaculia bacterium]|nr:ATP-binding protein [Thermoanaerobaculia bacterium]